jgi:hypothetical protein
LPGVPRAATFRPMLGRPPASPLAARLRLLLAAVLFSTGGAAIKAAAFTGWQVASFRSGIAALAVWALVPAARRRWTGRVLAVAAVYAAKICSLDIEDDRCGIVRRTKQKQA